MGSSEVLDVIGIAKTFGTLPSDVIGLDPSDSYTRYCFDESCAYIYNMMQPDKDGKTKTPRFREEEKRNSKTNNPGLDLFLSRENKQKQ